MRHRDAFATWSPQGGVADSVPYRVHRTREVLMTERRTAIVLVAILTVTSGCQDMPNRVVLPPGEQVVMSGEFCAGIAQFPCPQGLACVDDPRDDCDPTRGGADCGGVCVDGPVDPVAVDRNGDRVICGRSAGRTEEPNGAFTDNNLPEGSCPAGFTKAFLSPQPGEGSGT